MGTTYYIFLVLIVIAFLACIIITVFDNTDGKKVKKEEKRFDKKFKSRRSLYNDYVNNNIANNYYSYSNMFKKTSSNDLCYTTEVNIQINEPKITSVEEVVSTPIIRSIVSLDINE